MSSYLLILLSGTDVIMTSLGYLYVALLILFSYEEKTLAPH